MAEMKVQADGITVKLELTKIGERLAKEGKIVAPVKVTPELVAKREAATDAARKKSQALKKERLKKRKKRPLPPMTEKEKRRLAELDKRAKAHEKADKERAAEAKKAAAKTPKPNGDDDAEG